MKGAPTRRLRWGFALAGGVAVALCAWLYTPDQSEALLAPRYLRGPGDWVSVAGLRLHLRDDGPKDAPAVLFLHGFGSSLHTWEPWAQILSRDLRTIRLDLPGFGLTGPDPGGDYSDERNIAVLCALLDRLGIERTSVVGNSIGGRLAWKLAALRPTRVERLVLISPDGFSSPGSGSSRRDARAHRRRS